MADYVTGFGLALCFHSLFTKAILQTPLSSKWWYALYYYKDFIVIVMQLDSKKELSSTLIGYQLLTLTFLFQFRLLFVFLEGVEPFIFFIFDIYPKRGLSVACSEWYLTVSSNMYGVGMITSRTYLFMDHFSPNNPKMITSILFVTKVFLLFLA